MWYCVIWRWIWLADDNYPPAPTRLTTYHFNVADNQQAYGFYQFVFENTQQGEGVGDDDGRLVQIGELALLSEE